MNTRFQLLSGNAGLRTIALAGMLALSGCGNLSGLGGDSKYACKAPEGVACDSVSGTYANALHNNLPSQRQQQPVDASTTPSAPSPSTAPRHIPLAAAPAIATTGTLIPSPEANPLRSQARVLRLWTKPWEDTDGDLHDQSYLYVVANSGRWAIEHSQRQIVERYRPTFLKPGTTGKAIQKPLPPTQRPMPTHGGPTLPGNQATGPTGSDAFAGDRE